MSSRYKVWKEWAHGRPRFRVDGDGEFLGYAATERGAELLIEGDRVSDEIYRAPLEPRSRPKMFKGVAID
jgi:hypothetical protein